MTLHQRDYDKLIGQVRNRLRLRMILRGLAITLGSAAVSLVLAAYTAQHVKGKSVLLFMLRAAPFLLTAASAIFFLAIPLRKKVSATALELLVAEKCGIEERSVDSYLITKYQ